MRLTLRNMLGYLNDILESGDREDLGKRIDESDYAKQLLQRTQEVTGRMRLAAPPVIGKGSSHDANTVAEYLDHVLPTEQVQDFENRCLESDVYLGEVASCHYILTKVLSEPAAIDPNLKTDLYGLIEDPRRPTHRSAAAGSTEQDGVDRKKPEVPDYLREGRGSKTWVMAATVLIAAMIAGGVLFAMGPLDGNHPIARLFTSEPVEPPPEVADLPADGTLPPEVDLGTLDDPSESEPAPTPPDEPVAPGTGEPTELEQPGGVTPGEPTPPVEDPPIVDPTPPVDPIPSVEEPAGPTEPVDPTGPMPPDDQVAVVDPAEGTEPPIRPEEPTEAPAPPVASVPIGRLLSAEEVLLRYVPATDNYELLPARAALNTGDELIVLPTFRPMITVAGITMELDGGSRVKLVALDEDENPEITLRYGRAVMMTVGRADGTVKLNLGDRTGVLSFGDADSKAAAEVRPWRPLGTDPRTTPVSHGVDLYAASGDLTWKEGDKVLPLRAPHRQIVAAHPDDDPKQAAKIPAWIAARQLTALDRRAKPVIEQTLRADANPRPGAPPTDLRLRLIELTDIRKTEVRSLAFRSCGQIGAYAPLIKAFDDVDHKANWSVSAAALRDALLEGPKSANTMLTAFERFYPDNAERLFRMLWGFSPTGLADRGEAKVLVGFLEHPELEFRVLAFWNLQDITEMRLYYQPEDREAERKQAILQWEKRLEKGEIRPSAPRQTVPQ